MRPYQEEYIANCRAIRELTASPFPGNVPFDAGFHATMKSMEQAKQLSMRDTALLQENLLPLLDDIFRQDEETLEELEAFADALMTGAQALDLALSCQIYRALLNCARHRKDREAVIRRLYKVGMTRFGIWKMIQLFNLPNVREFSDQMRYYFVEAASYLKYFNEFSHDETKGYILRSLANIYLGRFDNWRDRLNIVRHTMRVFTDQRYRASAPSLPWKSYVSSIHRQMISVMPHNLSEGSLSPDEVTDIMESAHIIYERQYEQARSSGRPIQANGLLTYYSLEYGCGLITKEELLRCIEELMDTADTSLYDSTTEYQVLSLPAFYAQYLQTMPEMIPPRRGYITGLYRRLLWYVDAMPLDKVTDQTQLYIQQIMGKFIEIEDGISYRQLVLSLTSRFAPDLYAHGHVVGQMAKAICRAITAEEPGFFDDVPEFAAMPEGIGKRAAVQEYAYNAGLLHDIGYVNFTPLYSHAGRRRLQLEGDILELHAEAGQVQLADYPSTRAYADVAHGHHRWYDGSDGYPDSFRRRESPYRAVVDVIALADYLDSEENDNYIFSNQSVSFEKKIEKIQNLAGRRFSPMVTSWLRVPALLRRLRTLYENGRREGYYRCFLYNARHFQVESHDKNSFCQKRTY